MASITVTLTGTCATHGGSGAHLTFAVSGDAQRTFEMELSEAIAGVSQDDLLVFARCLLRLGKVGRTNAQLRTLFQNGVTVTV